MPSSYQQKNGLIATMLKSKGLLYFPKFNCFVPNKLIVQVDFYGHLARAVSSTSLFGLKADQEFCKGLLKCLNLAKKIYGPQNI